MSNDVIISGLSDKNLLRLHASVIDELKRRGVVRTKNNPVGDYTEWLVSTTLGLELVANSVAGYDAIDSKGVRYQIKGRRVTSDNPSRQLGAIRNMVAKEFDYLVAVIFDVNFDVATAVQIPHAVVAEYASYRKHTNAHFLHLRDTILADSRVQGIAALTSAGSSK